MMQVERWAVALFSGPVVPPRQSMQIGSHEEARECDAI